MINFLDKMFDSEQESDRPEIMGHRTVNQPGTPQGYFPSNDGVFPFGLTAMPNDDSTDTLGAASSVVHACVERIISRAVGAKMYTADFNPEAKPARPHYLMSRYHWYRQLYEQMLYTGNGLVWLDEQGNFNVGITRLSSYDEGANVWSIAVDRKGNQIKRHPGEGVIHFYLGRREGLVPHLVESPIRKIKKALILHNETRELLTDYAANGHRLAGTFQATREVMDQNRLKNMVFDMKRQLDTRARRFATMAVPNFLEFRPTGQVAHPMFEGIDIAIREICRVFGVPSELMGMTPYRSDYMNTDNHLLTESVFPLLDSVCGTWTEALGIGTRYWPLSLHRPTLNSAAHTLMGLAQTGIMTINELRQLTGLSPLPDHDIMPMTAGAPERSEDRQKQGGGGTRSNNSAHPGGGSAASDARRK